MKQIIKANLDMGKLPPDFTRVMATPLFEARPFIYKGVRFTCKPGDAYAPVFALFEDEREVLPELLLDGSVPVKRIFVKLTDLPEPLPPKHGRYYRDSTGPEGNIGILVDVTGEMAEYAGQPRVQANGRQLPSILAFLREVLTGKIEPDYTYIY